MHQQLDDALIKDKGRAHGAVMLLGTGCPGRKHCPLPVDLINAYFDVQSTYCLAGGLIVWMAPHTAQAHVSRSSLLLLLQDQQYKVGCSLVRQSQADLVEDDAQPPPAIARQRQPPQTQVLAC